jgi:hypothetical protein
MCRNNIPLKYFEIIHVSSSKTEVPSMFYSKKVLPFMEEMGVG